MSIAAIHSGEPIPIFIGNDYPYWKDKMMRNIISIDLNAWNIVENGVIVIDKDNITEAEKKVLALDNQVWLFITNHLIPEKYHEVKNIGSAKGVWEYLEKIGEGKSTQKEARFIFFGGNLKGSRGIKEKKKIQIIANSMLLPMNLNLSAPRMLIHTWL